MELFVKWRFLPTYEYFIYSVQIYIAPHLHYFYILDPTIKFHRILFFLELPYLYPGRTLIGKDSERGSCRLRNSVTKHRVEPLQYLE